MFPLPESNRHERQEPRFRSPYHSDCPIKPHCAYDDQRYHPILSASHGDTLYHTSRFMSSAAVDRIEEERDEDHSAELKQYGKDQKEEEESIPPAFIPLHPFKTPSAASPSPPMAPPSTSVLTARTLKLTIANTLFKKKKQRRSALPSTSTVSLTTPRVHSNRISGGERGDNTLTWQALPTRPPRPVSLDSCLYAFPTPTMLFRNGLVALVDYRKHKDSHRYEGTEAARLDSQRKSQGNRHLHAHDDGDKDGDDDDDDDPVMAPDTRQKHISLLKTMTRSVSRATTKAQRVLLKSQQRSSKLLRKALSTASSTTSLVISGHHLMDRPYLTARRSILGKASTVDGDASHRSLDPCSTSEQLCLSREVVGSGVRIRSPQCDDEQKGQDSHYGGYGRDPKSQQRQQQNLKHYRNLEILLPEVVTNPQRSGGMLFDLSEYFQSMSLKTGYGAEEKQHQQQQHRTGVDIRESRSQMDLLQSRGTAAAPDNVIKSVATLTNLSCDAGH
ncbi:hypothetical protein EDD11_009302 [Mortierella claussenii]|nr:hypothetical protein EDD11_009302 [Mortierella claussenii]